MKRCTACRGKGFKIVTESEAPRLLIQMHVQNGKIKLTCTVCHGKGFINAPF